MNLSLKISKVICSLLLLLFPVLLCYTATISHSLPLPATFYYLGPFLYGPTEYDGDPLSVVDGGIYEAFKKRNQKNFKIYSEAVTGGYLKWKKVNILFQTNKRDFGEMQILHQQQEPLMKLHQHLSNDPTALQFLSILVAELEPVFVSGIYTFEISGQYQIFFNETPFMADQFGRRYRTSIYLSAHNKYPTRLMFRLRGKVGTTLRIRSFPPITSSGSDTSSNINHKMVSMSKHSWTPDLVCDSYSYSSSTSSSTNNKKEGECTFYLGKIHSVVAVVIQSHSAEKTIQEVYSEIAVTDGSNNNNDIVKNFIEVSDTTTTNTNNNDNNNNNNNAFPISFCDSHQQQEHEFQNFEDEEKSILCAWKNRNQGGEIVNIPPLHTRTFSFGVNVKNEQLAFDYCFGDKQKELNPRGGGGDITIPVTFVIKSKSHGELGKIMMSFRCRDVVRDTFLVTFRDFDGGVAQAGVVLPKERMMSSNKKSRKILKRKEFPIMLSEHGVGATPSSQADSHKVGSASGSGFDFGIDGAFLIACDRHSAHNDESPTVPFAAIFIGYISRMRVMVMSMSSSVSSNSDNNNKNKLLIYNHYYGNPRRILLIGHSRGAHGALTFAQHFPHRVIGLIYLAGWTKKEHYGDSNRIFNLDRSTEMTTGIKESIIRAAIIDNELHLENLLHIPIFMRTGQEDSTVSPYYARRLFRLLKEAGHPNVTYVEIARQQHWWWNTLRDNDGGCMHDQQIRNFVKKVLSRIEDDEQQKLQQEEGEAEEETTTTTEKDFEFHPIPSHLLIPISATTMKRKKSAVLMMRHLHHQHQQLLATNDKNNNNNNNAKLKIAQIFFTYNSAGPATSHRNITILQQEIPQERSEVILFYDHQQQQQQAQEQEQQQQNFVTVNVKELLINGICWEKNNNNNDDDTSFVLCNTRKSTSSSCSSTTDGDSCSTEETDNLLRVSVSQHHQKKKKKLFGSTRRIIEGPLTITFFPSSSSSSSSTSFPYSISNNLEQFAIYIADTNLVAYDHDVPVMPFKEYLQSMSKNDFSSLLPSKRFQPRTILLVSLDISNQEEIEKEIFQEKFSLVPLLKTVTKTYIELEIEFDNGKKKKRKKKIFGTDLVFVSTFFNDKTGLCGLIIFAQTMKAMKHAINEIGSSSAPPMMRPPFNNLLPDFFISDSTLSHQGFGSFVIGGYYNDDMSVSEKQSFF